MASDSTTSPRCVSRLRGITSRTLDNEPTMRIKTRRNNKPDRLFGASEICTICFECVDESEERSIARLRCGHHFHLNCIGSYFNARGTQTQPRIHRIQHRGPDYVHPCSWSTKRRAMECPNCRDVEIHWCRRTHHSQQTNNPPSVHDFFSDDDDFCPSVIEDFRTRSIARLKCGHFFHLACAGCHFNAKKLIKCPNCEITEEGDGWKFHTQNNYIFVYEDMSTSSDESDAGYMYDADSSDDENDTSQDENSVSSNIATIPTRISSGGESNEREVENLNQSVPSPRIEGGDSGERLNHDVVFHTRNPVRTSNWLFPTNCQGFLEFWKRWTRFSSYRKH